jgi:hypothetical protein
MIRKTATACSTDIRLSVGQCVHALANSRDDAAVEEGTSFDVKVLAVGRLCLFLAEGACFVVG